MKNIRPMRLLAVLAAVILAKSTIVAAVTTDAEFTALAWNGNESCEQVPPLVAGGNGEPVNAPKDDIDLAGAWELRLDPNDQGIAERGYSGRVFRGHVPVMAGQDGAAEEMSAEDAPVKTGRQ